MLHLFVCLQVSYVIGSYNCFVCLRGFNLKNEWLDHCQINSHLKMMTWCGVKSDYSNDCDNFEVVDSPEASEEEIIETVQTPEKLDNSFDNQKHIKPVKDCDISYENVDSPPENSGCVISAAATTSYSNEKASITSTQSPQSYKNMLVCKYFASGACKFGENCRFFHEIESANNEPKISDCLESVDSPENICETIPINESLETVDSPEQHINDYSESHPTSENPICDESELKISVNESCTQVSAESVPTPVHDHENNELLEDIDSSDEDKKSDDTDIDINAEVSTPVHETEKSEVLEDIDSPEEDKISDNDSEISLSSLEDAHFPEPTENSTDSQKFNSNREERKKENKDRKIIYENNESQRKIPKMESNNSEFIPYKKSSSRSTSRGHSPHESRRHRTEIAPNDLRHRLSKNRAARRSNSSPRPTESQFENVESPEEFVEQSDQESEEEFIVLDSVEDDQ